MPTPIAFWRLNEQSGTTAADAIGSADGVYHGSPTLGEAASPSTDPNVLSVLLDGTDDYIDLLSSANASGLSMPTSAGTLMAWFKPPADDTQPFHDPSGNISGFLFYLSTDTTTVPAVTLRYSYTDENVDPPTPEGKMFYVQLADGTNSTVIISHDLDKSDNENDWYHVALTWGDGAGTLYVYGPIDATPTPTAVVPATGTLNWPTGTFDAVMAGRSTGSASFWLRGHLCDLKLYDSALTQSDIEIERNRRNYSDPTVPTSTSGEVVAGLAKAVAGAAGSFQQVTWSKGGAALDLTGATLTGVIRPRWGSARAITGTLTVDSDPTTGKFVWTYSAADVMDVGTHWVQFSATYDGRVEKTFAADWTVVWSL